MDLTTEHGIADARVARAWRHAHNLARPVCQDAHPCAAVLSLRLAAPVVPLPVRLGFVSLPLGIVPAFRTVGTALVVPGSPALFWSSESLAHCRWPRSADR